MRRVRCVSPHGGGHHGLDQDGRSVREGYDGPLAYPPNDGGYVSNGVLGTVAVGSEVDAPDDFTCDGFHFVDVATGAADPPAAPAPSLADLLKGDS
jgi:hypothetical protein